MSEAGGSIGNLPWKTPASLLQEMCVKKGFSPEYISASDGDPHDQLFIIHAVIGEDRGIGIAKTKKTARQIAAKDLLERLLTGPDAKEWSVPNVPSAEALSYVRGLMPELAAPILPHDREEDGGETPSALADAAKAGGIYILPSTNYIGELAELISRRHYNPPDYAETEKGPPHLREFTCQVTVGNLVETAVAKQKKEAKQLAASQMLIKLKQVPDTAIDMMEALRLTSDEEVLPITQNGNRPAKLPSSQEMNQSRPQPSAATLKKLEGLAVEKGWGASVFQPLKQLSKSGKVQILVKLNSLPEIVSYGEGETELEAKYDAAANLLELIDLADEQNGDDKEISAQ